jgi:hypothetical protein
MQQTKTENNFFVSTSMTRYEKVKIFALDKLRNGLSDKLLYHGYDHVLDVLGAAERLGAAENLSDDEMELLRVAVLYHDAGFIVDSRNHEEIGCDMAEKELPGFGFEKFEVAKICGMIRATKYPHKPAGKMEEIICDADLDYLGRDDFFEIGGKLFKELQLRGVVSKEQEWNRLQINFLTSHHYFTQTALSTREPKKQEHLEQVRKLVS